MFNLLKGIRKQTITIIASAIILNSTMGVAASSASIDQIKHVNSIHTNVQSTDEMNDDIIRKTQTGNNLSDVKEELEKMDPEKDYNEMEAVVIADTREDALKATEDVGGRLESYEMGVGVIRLREPIIEVLEEKKIDKTEKDYRIYPQIYYKAASLNTKSIKDDKYSSQYFHKQIKEAYMWEAGYTGKGVKVCVIDSGISTTSETFKNTVSYIDFSGTGIEDHDGHGTHVAGIIAAPADGKGIVGVAPEAELYIAKVGDDGSYPVSSICKAYRWAIDNGVDIINMSYGSVFNGSEYDVEKEFMYEMQENGIVPVSSAGNDNTPHPQTPAMYKPVISVAACDSVGRLAWFSNYNGSGEGYYGKWVDICAPGVGILSTITGESYGNKNGTSMASPVVAGALALLHGTPSVSNTGDSSEYDEMKSALESVKTEQDYMSSSGNVYGVHGGIDMSLSPYSVIPESEKEKTEPGTVSSDKTLPGTDISEKTIPSTNTSESFNKTSKILCEQAKEADNGIVKIEKEGAVISYSCIEEYRRKRIKPDITIQYNGETYTSEQIRGRYRHCRNVGSARFKIKSVRGNKELSKKLKGCILYFNITPHKITSDDVVKVRKGNGTSNIPVIPSSVYITLNGRRVRISDKMYQYEENKDGSLTVRFSKNYTGDIRWNPRN